MKEAVELLQEKVDIIIHNLREFIHLIHRPVWQDMNRKKRVYKRAIKILNEAIRPEG